MAPTIIIRISDGELEKINHLVKLGMYRSRADFVRQSTLIKLEKIENGKEKE